ncbi:hypothetical protein M3Y99_01051200 [Aphelenchoides fujianensis]|nr:hypothetical protein M3Y99_01051200 [Aphelenchoides fujianensis]
MGVPRKETAAPAEDGVSENVAVESIGSAAGRSVWISVLKVITMLLFLAGLCGAFVFAINSKNEQPTTEPPHFNSTVPYTPAMTQYSEDGLYVFNVMTLRHEKLTYKGDSFWYQDDEKQELTYKLDNATVVWVFPQTTFWGQIDESGAVIKCDEDPSTGYTDYLEQLSLAEMYNRHSEMRHLHGDTEVFVFDGHPTEWKRQGVQPFLVQAYAAENDGRLMGFQAYYDADINKGWTFLGYTFDDMTAGTPPHDHDYATLPGICQPEKAGINH